ncbi:MULTISPECIES: SDR family oxidoreductase [Nostocales]|uniref:SDR family oxidoreductase n=3 Tax=Nostocales TaxID=1161 RepID=A0A8S9SYM5_9CYAN|nr:SDR family oxidoreductase [Tolypothrix bouteillei]KAF3884343.1 SDR family oxidoreductase [Tolypothrix bouteillei VB521301]
MPKTILITGASTGIGRATAIYFAEKGWQVVATMRSPQKAHPTLNHSRIMLLELDVTNDVSIKQAFDAAVEKYGALDVVLNNAGYGLFGPIEALGMAEIDKQIQTNLYGVLRVMQSAIPIMRQQKQGIIINVTSIGGRVGFPYTAAYHATKFGVEGMSEAARFELAPHGIRIKIIEPGGIKTDFSSRSLEFIKHPAYEPQQGNYEALLKDNRSWAQPEEVAKVIYRAATDGTDKLRYLAKPGPFFQLYKLMPDRLWRAFGYYLLNKKPRAV